MQSMDSDTRHSQSVLSGEHCLPSGLCVPADYGIQFYTYWLAFLPDNRQNFF